jgi:hypothetical protein
MKDEVLRIRQPNTSAPRPYDSELVPPVSASVENGLVVKTYEGSWIWVPEFEEIPEILSSNVVNISTSHLSRTTDAGLLYAGFVSIPADGTWTFYNTSDEGTILRIHDSLVLDDDFNHSGAEKSGTIKLKAGLHPIRLYYRSATAAPSLNLKWSGPGTAKADIPDAALFRDGEPSPIPIANYDTASTIGTAQASIAVLNNDFDDGLPSPLGIQSVSDTQFGTATISGSSILYTADAGKYGIDQFTYTISDGQYTAEATVTVDVLVAATDPWLPLNETTGSTVAEAGGTVAGSHAGFADSEAAHIVGKHSYALTFDGVDDQVNLSSLTLPSGSSPRTISAWVRVPAISGVEVQSILSYGQNNTGERFTFRLDSDHRLRLEVSGGFITGNTPVNDGNWHHVAVVVDDFNSNGTTDVNEARLYVDGSLEAVSSSGSEPINTNPSGTPAIGGSNHATNYNLKGDIDELRIFNTALSGPEVAILAAETAADIDGNLWYLRNLGNAVPTLVDWGADSNADSYSHYAAYALGGSPHWFDPGMLPLFTKTPSGFDYLQYRSLPQARPMASIASRSHIDQVGISIPPSSSGMCGRSGELVRIVIQLGRQGDP